MLCLGTSFGGHPVSDDVVLSVLDRAAELGLPCVDTSPRYLQGRAESIVGTWLTSRHLKIDVWSKIYCGTDNRVRGRSLVSHPFTSIKRSCDRLGSTLNCTLLEGSTQHCSPAELSDLIQELSESGMTDQVGIQFPNASALLALRLTLPEWCWARLRVFLFFNSVVATRMSGKISMCRRLSLPVAAYGVFLGGAAIRRKRVPSYVRSWFEHLGFEQHCLPSSRQLGCSHDHRFRSSIRDSLIAVVEEKDIDTVVIGASTPDQLSHTHEHWAAIT